jgi:hypothetical protein
VMSVLYSLLVCVCVVCVFVVCVVFMWCYVARCVWWLSPSAVGLVVKYLVANEMPGFDSRTAHLLCSTPHKYSHVTLQRHTLHSSSDAIPPSPTNCTRHAPRPRYQYTTYAHYSYNQIMTLAINGVNRFLSSLSCITRHEQQHNIYPTQSVELWPHTRHRDRWCREVRMYQVSEV